MFLIYINDLVNLSTTGDFVLFADDTNLFVPGQTVIEAYKNAQIVLKARGGGGVNTIFSVFTYVTELLKTNK